MGMPLPSESFTGISAQFRDPKNPEDARKLALELAQARDAIDEEIQSNVMTLQQQGATMISPLVDSQGFPIATTDIVSVRTARSKIIALRNDREALEGRMRELLEVALAKGAGDSSRDASGHSGSNSSEAVSSTSRVWARRPNDPPNGVSMLVDTREGDASEWSQVGGMEAFARIHTVADASPAQTADMRPGDEILSFGGLDSTSAHRNASRKDLGKLPSVVQEGKEIILVALRTDTQGQKVVKRIRLTPASGWGGRGLLGCHIVPI